MRVSPSPLPLNDVAVQIPVTTAPVFVVSNFLPALKYNSTAPSPITFIPSSDPCGLIKISFPELRYVSTPFELSITRFPLVFVILEALSR